MLQRARLTAPLAHQIEERAMLLKQGGGQTNTKALYYKQKREEEVTNHTRRLTSWSSGHTDSSHSQRGMDVYVFNITSRVAGERTHCSNFCKKDREKSHPCWVLLCFDAAVCSGSGHTVGEGGFAPWLRSDCAIVSGCWSKKSSSTWNNKNENKTSPTCLWLKAAVIILCILYSQVLILVTCMRQSIGVYPKKFSTSALAPCSRRIFTMRWQQFAQALCSGVCFFFPPVLGSAPAPSRFWITRKYRPFSAGFSAAEQAAFSGVSPSRFVANTSAPWLRKRSTCSSRPRRAARCRGVSLDSLVLMLTSAPFCNSSSAHL